MVAGLKWDGKNDGPLHMREELTVNLGSGADILPDLDVFGQSEIGKKIISMVDGKPLHKIIEMEIERRSVKLDSDDAIFEMSIDQGTIFANDKSIPICELEIELYSGPDQAIEEMGARIKEKKGYTPEGLSKYARGLQLLEKEIY